jgi:lysophospholipase L1-like esterase
MNFSLCVDSKVTKKLVLVFIVVIELVLGGLFLVWFRQQREMTQTVQLTQSTQVKKVTKINKDNLVFPKEGEYDYYFELEPNTTVKDQPDWLPYEAVYTHNQDGLNDRKDYEITTPPNTFRIITLGDSFTYGHYVNTEDSWPEKLEVYLNERSKSKQKYEVLNLGVHGFDFPYIVKRYKELGAKYNPDLVLWFESGSGFYRFTELMRPFINKCEAQNVQSKKGINEVEHYHHCWIKAQKKMIAQHSREQIDSILSAELENFFQTLSPEQLIYFSFTKDELGKKPLKLIDQWQDDYPEASFVNIVPSLSNNQRLPDGHPNKEGHELIAREIFDYLKSHQFLEE